jgi:hypothetical protein
MDQPRLLAEFLLSNGAPHWVAGEDSAKHYSILLRLANAPLDAVTVIYQLDDSYLTPIRMVPAGVPDFQEYITASGDFEIRVAMRKVSEINAIEGLLSGKLSDALLSNYGSNLSESITNAIQDLREHWTRNDRRQNQQVQATSESNQSAEESTK